MTGHEEEKEETLRVRLTQTVMARVRLVERYSGRNPSELAREWIELGLENYLKRPLFKQWVKDKA